MKNSADGHILVVDDNEMNRDMLSRRLARRGYTVDTAADGRAALELIGRKSFDIVLLDIMMPGIDGMEVLRIVRERHTAADLPIIMATARDESDDVVSALSLGANDYVTKPLDAQVVTARVRTQLALKRANDELAEAHARMKKDLDAAARVQQALLPQTLPATDLASFAWQYRPCEELAGDALNMFRVDDRYVCMYVLDVSGHGVPAALLSVAVTRNLSPSADHSSLDPVTVARRLNAIYPMSSNGSHYFTLLFGLLDTQTGVLRFVTAGHPGPILVRHGESARCLDVRGYPIGVVSEAEYEESQVVLEPGDRLYLHSDGVTEESTNGSSEQFGRDRLAESLTRSAGKSLSESLETVIADLGVWHGGDAFTDDVSLLAVERPLAC
jgi:sigma-B regulation protein RsbU (phosphoserine phosphatase)